MIQYSGIKNGLEGLDVNLNNVLAAFSFYNPNSFNNFVYPDTWATNSCTGILNENNDFYNFSGSGFFNGSNHMFLSGKNITLENSLIFLSYEKRRKGSEILLSSFDGNLGSSYSGFTLGVNDSNKLYLSYWNNVEGYFNLTFKNILSDKNLILLYKDGPILSIGKYNNNSFSFEIETFEIFQNVFIESNSFYLGGHPSRNVFNNKDLNFSGTIDKFFIINDQNVYFDKDALGFGLFSNLAYDQENIESICFPTGYFSGSGFLYSGVTGTFLSGYEIVTTGITGYQFISSGITYTGITGYENVSIGFYTDNCGVSQELFVQSPLSGLITIDNSFNQALTGLIITTGYIEIINSGSISGTEMIWTTGLFCSNESSFLVSSGNAVDLNYLSSLSYKEISLFSNIEGSKDKIEIFFEPYSNKTLQYNKDLIFNDSNSSFFTNDASLPDELLLFANGQALISSGYISTTSGYETINTPNFDYFITGSNIEFDKKFNLEDSLFYDYISGYSYGISTGSRLVTIPNNMTGLYWVFLNGQKLIENFDYSKDIVFNLKNEITGGVINQGAYGASVAINNNGNILVIGGPKDNTGGTNAGAAIICTGNPNAGWTVVQKITGNNSNSEYGTSVAINDDGSIIAIGGPVDNLNQVDPIGAVMIFTGNATAGWTFKQKISGDTNNSEYGTSLAMSESGNIIIMGGPFDDPNGISNAGGTMIFTGNATNGWEFRQKLSGDVSNDLYGASIDLSQDGSIIVMGGPFVDYTGISNAGGAKIFTGNAIDGWTFKQIISGVATQDRYGTSVAINNNGGVIVMGGIGYDPPGSGNINIGATRIFTGNANLGWEFVQLITGANSKLSSNFGSHVSINGSGNLIALAGGANAGNITIYSGNNTNTSWTPTMMPVLYNSTGLVDIAFNQSGDILLAGFITDNNGSGRGLVYLNSNNDIVLYENLSGLNSYLFVKIPENLTYISGNINSIKLTGGFNHQNSQVYYNGLKQKINTRYIENGSLDLISDNFIVNENLNIIYNNTDDFLT